MTWGTYKKKKDIFKDPFEVKIYFGDKNKKIKRKNH